MAALVSSVMPHMTVTKAEKEVTGKNGPSCVSLSSGKKVFPRNPSAEFPSNFIGHELGHILATSSVTGLDHWDKACATLTNRGVILAGKKGQWLGLLHVVSSCLSLAKKSFMQLSRIIILVLPV